MAPMITWNMV